jgi:hypothetical protein
LNKKLYIFSIFLFSTVFLQNIYSQNFARASDWKKYRKEIIIQAGVAEFLGDLGGLDKIGSTKSPVDLELVLTRPAISLAYRYKFAKNINWHTSFNYLVVAGDDKLTAEPYRNNRNLNFKSNIFELATRLELSFFSNKIGHRYGIKRTISRRHKSRSWEFIGFVGIGAFYFNPKGQNAAGNYVALRNLHTEGQGLDGGASPYSNFAISIPMGIAYRMILSKLWCVGVELNYRKTFTDYIDDCSTVYYDNTALKDNYGDLSAQMADPNIGAIPGATLPAGDGSGAQRGNSKDMDAYMGIQITVGRFFAPKRGKSRLRSKF